MDTSDAQMRINIARTILQFFGIRVDWKKYTWAEMSDLYQRLNMSQNIRRRWKIDPDWATLTKEQLAEIYDIGVYEGEVHKRVAF